MYISNSYILPKNWTVETLMKPHESEPFNPSIANAFYCTGDIEVWGRGIHKICESCRKFGTAKPEYTVLSDDLTVQFTALESAKIPDSKIPKHQGDVLENGIMEELQKDARLNQKELAKRLQTSLPSIQRAMNKLKESGSIVRKGGKRFGYWEIN